MVYLAKVQLSNSKCNGKRFAATGSKENSVLNTYSIITSAYAITKKNSLLTMFINTVNGYFQVCCTQMVWMNMNVAISTHKRNIMINQKKFTYSSESILDK